MREIDIEITTSEDFEPSDRLRVALEAVIAARAAIEAGTDGDEVEGFASKLQLGSLGGTVDPAGTNSWRDGCWWFSNDDLSCGWYQEGGKSCIGYQV